MSNAFSKEEKVAFDEILEGFHDQLVLSSLVNKFNTGMTDMERSSDTIWRPQPYIAQSYDGSDATSNFNDSTQLSVPATIGYQKHSTALLTAKQLRDMLQEKRLGQAAAQKLASDINKSVTDVISNQGTVVVARSAAASGFDDVSECDATLNELGVDYANRCLGLSSRDYNGMASNLAARQTINEMPTAAYRRAYVGEVSGFETYKMDYANRLTAAAGTTVTINGANQYYTPRATSTASGPGEVSNVDIRIIEVLTGSGGSGTVKISPPIISGGGSTDAEEQYKNVSATPADGAAITFLNIATASVNPFWTKDSIELLPASLGMHDKSSDQIIRARTDQGIEVVMQRDFDINTQQTKYRWDVLYGVVNLQPQMSGLMLFSQT